MENFKSFGGKLVVPLMEGYTAVTGPNGSGKSNITDAILFVLGPKSSKAVRAGKLTDLIFEQDYFCAVIVYDRTGRACHSAYLTFTAEGDPEGISNDNSAGNLEDNPQ